jgi:hypothetical protein
MDTNPKQRRQASLSEWEGEGGALSRNPSRAAAPAADRSERRGTDQRGLDREHASDSRGEHRFPDTHQTKAEQDARKGRDELKRRLGGDHDRR